MISLRRSFSYASYYYLLYVGAFVLVASLSWLLLRGSIQIQNLPLQDYAGYRCLSSAKDDGPTFRVLDAVYSGHTTLIDTLCKNETLAQSYGAVEVQRVHPDNIDLRSIYELRYGLILAKPELMNRTDILEGRGYRLVAGYPDYGSQLIALDGVPELTREYFDGKKLGLIDDPNSISAYQIPKAVLQSHQLDKKVLNIIYFKSHRQLYEALYAGQVDVIAFMLMHSEGANSIDLPEGLQLASGLSGPGWYIHPELYHTSVHCEVAAALSSDAADSKVAYLRQMKLAGGCSEAD